MCACGCLVFILMMVIGLIGIAATEVSPGAGVLVAVIFLLMCAPVIYGQIRVSRDEKRKREAAAQAERDTRELARLYLLEGKQLDAIKTCKDFYDCSLSKAESIVREIQFEIDYDRAHMYDDLLHDEDEAPPPPPPGPEVTVLDSRRRGMVGLAVLFLFAAGLYFAILVTVDLLLALGLSGFFAVWGVMFIKFSRSPSDELYVLIGNRPMRKRKVVLLTLAIAFGFIMLMAALTSILSAVAPTP